MQQSTTKDLILFPIFLLLFRHSFYNDFSEGEGEKSTLTLYGIITGTGPVRLRDLIGRGIVWLPTNHGRRRRRTVA